MTTYRRAVQKYYSVVPSEIYNHPNLSFEAKGFMCWVLGQADTWQININHIMKKFSIGRHKILSITKELKEAGYIYHYKKGFEEGWEYIVSDVSMTEEEFKNSLRKVRFPNSSVSEQFGNPHLINTNTYTQEEIINQEPELSDVKGNQEKDDDFLFENKIKEVCKITPSPYVLSHVEQAYAKHRDDIMNIDAWIKTVVENAIKQEAAEKERDKKFEKRRSFAKEKEKQNPNNWIYDRMNDLLAYITGALEYKYPIRQDLDFWQGQGL